MKTIWAIIIICILCIILYYYGNNKPRKIKKIKKTKNKKEKFDTIEMMDEFDKNIVDEEYNEDVMELYNNYRQLYKEDRKNNTGLRNAYRANKILEHNIIPNANNHINRMDTREGLHNNMAELGNNIDDLVILGDMMLLEDMMDEHLLVNEIMQGTEVNDILNDVERHQRHNNHGRNGMNINMDNTIRDRRQRANDIRRQVQTQEEYFQPKIFPDSQNVHDTNVRSQLHERYHHIKSANSKAKIKINKQDIDKHFGDIPAVKKMLGSRNKLSDMEDTESDILLGVIARAYDPVNKKRKKNIIKSIRSALKDVGDNTCLTGRVNRTLDSLTLMDNNKKISETVKTIPIMRKEILDKSYNILQQTLDDADDKTRDDYNNGVENNNVHHLIADVKNKISNISEDYKDSDHKEKVQEIIEEAKMGVD